MAKYDQGGGCACGVQKVCNCEHASVPLVPTKAKPVARMKITDAMIDAGMEALKRQSEDHAMKNGRPMPDFDDMPDEVLAEGKAVVRAVIQAAADTYLKEKFG